MLSKKPAAPAYHTRSQIKTPEKPLPMSNSSGRPSDPELLLRQIYVDSDRIQAMARGLLIQHYPHTGETKVATEYWASTRGEQGEWVTREQAAQELARMSMRMVDGGEAAQAGTELAAADLQLPSVEQAA